MISRKYAKTLLHIALPWNKLRYCPPSHHIVSRSRDILQHVLYHKRCVSTKELQQRRLELTSNDPSLEDTANVWKDVFLPHIANVADELKSRDSHLSQPVPSPDLLARQFAINGAVKLPGLYRPSDIGSVLLDLGKMDDPYRLFWHKDEPGSLQATRSHLGIQTHVKAPEQTWDTAPFLNHLAPGL